MRRSEKERKTEKDRKTRESERARPSGEQDREIKERMTETERPREN